MLTVHHSLCQYGCNSVKRSELEFLTKASGIGRYFSLIPTALLFIYLIGLPSPALAYLDPGTGSMILQIVLGALVGAATVVKVYWYRIKSFFSSKKSDSTEEPD
jgi:hypothetical protein